MSNELSQELPPPSVGNYFDSFAKSGLYDKDAEDFGWLPIADKLAERALDAKPGDDVNSVLDLATGTGIVIESIKRRMQPERTVAVDLSADMLELFRQKKDIASGVVLQQDSVHHYAETCQETFDLVTFLCAAEYLPNLPFTLRKIAQLLDENGVLAFTYLPQTGEQPPEEFVDSTAKIGETIIRYRWPVNEVEEALTDSGLVIADNLDMSDIQEMEGYDYRFITATRPVA
jgi:predicted TPR repeat methyltransferase